MWIRAAPAGPLSRCLFSGLGPVLDGGRASNELNVCGPTDERGGCDGDGGGAGVAAD